MSATKSFLAMATVVTLKGFPALASFIEGFARGWMRAASKYNGSAFRDAVTPTQISVPSNFDWSTDGQYPLGLAYGFSTGLGRGIVARATTNPLSFMVGAVPLLELMF